MVERAAVALEVAPVAGEVMAGIVVVAPVASAAQAGAVGRGQAAQAEAKAAE